jgi:hypothetical protein
VLRRCSGASFTERPTCRPRRRADAMPAYVLSEITLRSNYAIAPTIENTMRPAAVLVLENAECMFSELISAGRLKIQYEFITRSAVAGVVGI